MPGTESGVIGYNVVIMEGQESSREEEVRQLVTAVRRNPIAWAAVGTPATLLMVMLALSFGASREPAMEGPTAAVLAAFLLVSLAEVALMPWYFLDQAAKGLAFPLDPERVRAFTNFYGIAMLGGTTPCVLGLVYYILSGNLLLALLLFAIGLAGLLFYGLRAEAIVLRHLPEPPEPRDAN